MLLESRGVEAAEEWNKDSIYVAGDRVSRDGIIYEAAWWTQGEDPAGHAGEWGVWKLVKENSSIYKLMKEYGFDGVDIDLEHGINAKYMEKALRRLSKKVGKSLVITMAPQTLDMQNTKTEYFKLALKIKDILTIVNTQYYNSGSMLGADGKVYFRGSVDFLTALAAIQLENGLRPDQTGIGVPASVKGAGSGYVSPSIVNKALNHLAKGKKGGSYKPKKKYKRFRGVMCWPVNWDADNEYKFLKKVYPVVSQLS